MPPSAPPRFRRRLRRVPAPDGLRRPPAGARHCWPSRGRRRASAHASEPFVSLRAAPVPASPARSAPSWRAVPCGSWKPSAYRLSLIAYRPSPIAYRPWHIGYHASRFTFYASPLTFYVSRLTLHAQISLNVLLRDALQSLLRHPCEQIPGQHQGLFNSAVDHSLSDELRLKAVYEHNQ